MQFNCNFKSFVLRGDIPMLVYLENDGEDGFLHFIVWPEDLGTVDLKMQWPIAVAEKALTNLDLAAAQAVFDSQIGSMLGAVLGEGE